MVEVVARPGRRMRYRGTTCEIPADFEIATCEKCGAEWMSTAEVLELGKMIEPEVRRRHVRLIEYLRSGSAQDKPTPTCAGDE